MAVIISMLPCNPTYDQKRPFPPLKEMRASVEDNVTTSSLLIYKRAPLDARSQNPLRVFHGGMPSRRIPL
jgi:hypothetical protein